MLNKISIKSRMIVFILLTIAIFSIVGVLSQLTLKQDAITNEKTSDDLRIITASANVNYITNQQYTQLLLEINMGSIRWIDAHSRIRNAIQNVQIIFSRFNNSLPEEMKQTQKAQELFEAQDYMIGTYVSLMRFFKENQNNKSQENLNSYIESSMITAADSVVVKMNAITDQKYKDIQKLDAESNLKSIAVGKQIIVALALGTLIAVIFGLFLMYSIVKPTRDLTDVIKLISKGEFDTRAKILGTDEIAELGIAFNNLLNEREKTLTNIDLQHKQLNNSVMGLLNTVADLSEKDLSVRALVTEDATGPVADALNLLASETSETLKEVKQISANVNQASNKVNSHLKSINMLAVEEQNRAIDTSDQMKIMIDKINTISKFASETNVMAKKTTSSTLTAHDLVTANLSGMSKIRETIGDTGKKIKKLGERSQEISQVIKLIDNIAERTTILALNASMQSAATGNNDSGFTIIVDEIKRLAETSRDSTSQISALVGNIQNETNETIKTMDATISHVVDGSQKATTAANQMKVVLETTSQLENAVSEIADASAEQVTINENLKGKSEKVLLSTQATGKELKSLTALSQDMSTYAGQLVESVDVFKLESNSSV